MMGMNERGADRNRVILAGTLLTRHGTMPVRLRDLSRSGAQVIGGLDLEDDSDVILEYRGLFAAARIVWTGDGGIGLRFYRAQAALPCAAAA